MSATESGELIPATRAANGHFLPGVSGNPTGMKPRAAAWRRIFDEEIDEEKTRALIRKEYELAMSGDELARRHIIERKVAALRDVESPAILGELSGTLTEQGRAILTATAQGTLTPAQGASMLVALGSHARAMEIDELVKRIAALEATRGQKT